MDAAAGKPTAPLLFMYYFNKKKTFCQECFPDTMKKGGRNFYWHRDKRRDSRVEGEREKAPVLFDCHGLVF